MNGHSKYCKLEPDGECYKWFRADTTEFDNDSNKWLVVIGASSFGFNAAAESIQTRDPTGNILDSWENIAFGVAASETLVGLPRRMLVPPDGDVVMTAAAGLSLVSCCCLEKALAIL